MDSTKEAKETLNTINRALPNIHSYLCNVLKKESLSLEAEALRARYESMLMSLEKISKQGDAQQNGGQQLQRHSTVIGLRGNTLPSPRRRTESDMFSLKHGSMDGLHSIPEKSKSIPELVGFLLCQDDHQRWHKRHCRLTAHQMTLNVHETADDDKPVKVVSLLGAKYMSSPPECEKDLCFAIKAPTGELSILSSSNSFQLYTFAAYSEVDLNKWEAAIEDAVANARPVSQWVGESPHWRDPLLSGGKGEDELPGSIQGRPPEPLPLHDSDEGNLSDCTIYEDIDDLVEQFDKTMQATAQAMSEMSPKKPKKKRRRTFFEKNSNSKVLTERKTQLETGDHFKAHLYKRTGSSWKKKWCQLKGCIFSYTKSQSDQNPHEHILLRAEVTVVKDSKKQYAFKLACKGVREMFFAADNEDDLLEWVMRLQNASKRSDDLSGLVDDSGVEEGGDTLPEGIYNVPRNMLVGDTPIFDPSAPGNTPIAGGIYDVPRSLLGDGNQSFTGSQGMEFHMSGSPFDIYDVPRSTMGHSPDDDTIYDYPMDFDLDDMEIYDYPPDAAQLEEILGGPSRDSNSSNEYPLGDNDYSSHSHTPGSGDGTISSNGSYRQSGSLGSIEDIPSGAATYFGDGYRSLPHNKPQDVESFLSSIGGHKASLGTNHTSLTPVTSTVEFGQTMKTGTLLRKERLKWSHCYCLIRNSFLECHKSNATTMGKPLLKLLLLGSEVLPLQDAKKPWAFQIKHPRRDGVLLFAAESASEYKVWTDAFKNASSIQVKQVNTMEDIRISDSDLKKRWKGPEESQSSSSKTVDEDSKKKSFFSRNSQRKGSRKSRNQSEFFNIPNDVDGSSPKMQRSVSMELVTRPVDSTPFGPKIASQAHRAISPEGLLYFQGYLRLKSSRDDKWARLWCLYEDLTIKCHTSQRNLTIVKQVLLRGCTIARADAEANRKFTFRVWNSETMETHFFSATEEDEYLSWVTEITKGAIKQVPTAATTYDDVPTIVYYYPKDYQPPQSTIQTTPTSQTTPTRRLSSGRPEDSDATKKSLFELPGVTHHGPLKKRSDKGNWNNRYCRLRDSCLYVYFTGSDQTPITVLAVKHCKVEAVKLPPEETTEEFTFTVAVKGGKTHMFAAADEQDIQAWLKVLQDCVLLGSSPRMRSNSKSSRSQSPLLSSQSKGSPMPSPGRKRGNNLISYVPASSLVDYSNAGYCEVLHEQGVWSRNWCTLHQNCFYVYQSKESKSSIKTLVLQDYKVEPVHLPGKQFTVSLSHSGSPSLMVAFHNQMDMMKWFECLEAATKTVPEQKNSEPVKQEIAEKPEKVVDTEVADVLEDITESGNTTPSPLGQEIHADRLNSFPELGEGPLNALQYKEKCRLVMGHFEKRIKKTRKVALQTEESLRQQRLQLSSLKEKFLEHIERLKGANETETSQKKMKEMQVKLSQIDKILPYLEKYMQANRQAEMQTLAVLKEGCTVKLQELENRYHTRSSSVPGGTPGIEKIERRMSMPSSIGSSPRSKQKMTRIKSKKPEQVLSPQQESIETELPCSLSDASSTSLTSGHQLEMQTSDGGCRKEEQLLEEPAYAVVGHLKHKREPSLPEHYVKLQLNQTLDMTGQHSPQQQHLRQQKQQQQDGVHYSTVQVNPRHQPRLKNETLLPKEELISQDRSTPPIVLDGQETWLEGGDDRTCESPHSPLAFTSTAGTGDEVDADEIMVSLNTSSDTSLGPGILDTVLEEGGCFPVCNVTPSVVTPTNPFNENEEGRPVCNSQSTPPPPPPPQSTPPSSPPPQSNPLLSPSPPPPPQSNPPPLSPSPPPPPQYNPPPLSPSPPPPPQSNPPPSSPPPPPTIIKPSSTPCATVSPTEQSLFRASLSDQNGISSTSKPPPPPVMKKMRSPLRNKSPSPAVVDSSSTTVPPPFPKKLNRSSTCNVLPPPPPVKAKPKRARASTFNDVPNSSNEEASSKNISTIAQRLKAFQ